MFASLASREATKAAVGIAEGRAGSAGMATARHGTNSWHDAESSGSARFGSSFALGLACLVAGALIALALRGRREPGPEADRALADARVDHLLVSSGGSGVRVNRWKPLQKQRETCVSQVSPGNAVLLSCSHALMLSRSLALVLSCSHALVLSCSGRSWRSACHAAGIGWS